MTPVAAGLSDALPAYQIVKNPTQRYRGHRVFVLSFGTAYLTPSTLGCPLFFGPRGVGGENIRGQFSRRQAGNPIFFRPAFIESTYPIPA